MNPYGHFDDISREYRITRPDTPLPWLNYLGSQDFLGIVSNTAGGYCFYKDARLRRLTRYRYNSCPMDINGRYLYVRDGQSVWNPGWKPTCAALDAYECRHGLGYTTITGEKDGLEVQVTYFIPVGETLEVWSVRVRNKSGRARNVSLFGFVEWCLWDAWDDQTNFQRNFSTGQVEVEDSAVFHVTEYRERRNHFAYFSCSESTAGFDTSRDAFVGVHNGLDKPRAVLAGRCTGSVAHGWQPVAAHQVDLSLPPGEERRFHFLLGYAENPPEEKFSSPGVADKAPFRAARERFADSQAVDAALDALAQYWDELLGHYQAQAENPHLARMVNTWNQYQCMTTFNLSRSASLFESGIGRGMGFRDSNQDVLGFVHLIPARARERILDIAATQLSDGTCYHQYQPLTKKGNSDIGGGFNDDPLWMHLSTSAYIKETGDASILSDRIGYADQPDGGATLLDHLETSLRYTLSNLGPHGLPLIGHADWNDCLNLNCFSTTPGESFQLAGDIGHSQAESVMIAGLFCAACDEMEGLYRLLGRAADAERVKRHGEQMRQTILRHGWDGRWFLRAYDAAGRKLGSKDNAEGQIFIESQGWGVLGRVGLDSGQAAQALDSVRERLFTPHGIVLQQPAFATYHVELGEISSYPPGYKENAGIFTHNNTWIQIAEAMLGRGDRALEYYLSICPSAKEAIIDTYRAEPYVYSQMTAGPDAATHGEAKNSWLTGTCSWSFVAASQYILGVRPDFAGLRVDPCIPREWKGFKVRRVFRGATYRIEVRNPAGVSRGVKSVTVDGKPLADNLIPAAAGREVDVVVEMG
ncbi:MAG TPA: glycosyl transferase [Phycisphaerales bacterium]|nr:glycosyl transferase [Phycisphaerales bacterium]